MRIQKTKALGHHADDIARPPVDDELSADHTPIAAEFLLPVCVAQDHRLWASRGIIRSAKGPAEHRLDLEDGQYAISYSQGLNPFWFSKPGYGNRRVSPHSDVFEDTVFFSISEVKRRPLIY